MRCVAGKKPKTFITDGAPNLYEAYMRKFWTQNKDTRTEHIRHIRLQGDYNNNRMERVNGEIRDREEAMRGVERKDSPIMTGYQLFHYYIRPHEALDNKTPSEKAGIEIKGEDKWLTLIQNAAIELGLRNRPTPRPICSVKRTAI